VLLLLLLILLTMLPILLPMPLPMLPIPLPMLSMPPKHSLALEEKKSSLGRIAFNGLFPQRRPLCTVAARTA
jgi:hypothetical protein